MRYGKGKEYSGGKLSFEGEYLNGPKNGKGKEYWLGKLSFEGEYLNGERWNGKEKVYYEDDVELTSGTFEIEYLNGEEIKQNNIWLI